MVIYILNYSVNAASNPYSEYKYFSTLENLNKGKESLMKKDEELGELAMSNETGQYLWYSYTRKVDFNM